jgi:hypothetical protein
MEGPGPKRRLVLYSDSEDSDDVPFSVLLERAQHAPRLPPAAASAQRAGAEEQRADDCDETQVTRFDVFRTAYHYVAGGGGARGVLRGGPQFGRRGGIGEGTGRGLACCAPCWARWVTATHPGPRNAA